jgi:hypothetical protein
LLFNEHVKRERVVGVVGVVDVFVFYDDVPEDEKCFAAAVVRDRRCRYPPRTKSTKTKTSGGAEEKALLSFCDQEKKQQKKLWVQT